MKTLRSWGLDIDEAHFMAGAPKGPLLDKIKPHLFFDDQVHRNENSKVLKSLRSTTSNRQQNMDFQLLMFLGESQMRVKSALMKERIPAILLKTRLAPKKKLPNNDLL